ncbi:hypothetical protein CAOG_02590 [Capsaspora owczarzaki ATCC 30864]|uniref:Uncharacterized protein n=1 Tax=Capsaspora owczarzaki (strain ATCC 30864) TaxID=595528 RepID=A0A0D2X1V3_CAPO3|nr:hypothetical protein CAOG_02590 [Capsaspora owczarzaki ATCC 30864]KJE91459.1 hypothetical protein CAOG_002590 [Capsaspora owczarzaki ATCC 30864]|eukprot:XP_004349340.1 hypothetical protein CAOG_02590 [Capsaspora owczarzaki ATCC 30864]
MILRPRSSRASVLSAAAAAAAGAVIALGLLLSLAAVRCSATTDNADRHSHGSHLRQPLALHAARSEEASSSLLLDGGAAEHPSSATRSDEPAVRNLADSSGSGASSFTGPDDDVRALMTLAADASDGALAGPVYEGLPVPDYSTTYLPCPGAYCGRVLAVVPANGSVGAHVRLATGECGACPDGYRSDGYVCLPCSEPIPAYAWMYLIGMALAYYYPATAVVLVNWANVRVRQHLISATLETVLAILFAVLVNTPAWTLDLTGCAVSSVDDFYSMLHNPEIDFEYVLQCGQQAVYPLFSIVLEIFGFQFALLLLFRVPLVWLQPKSQFDRDVLLMSFFLLPLAALAFVLFCGPLYYAFPYLGIVFSLLSTTGALSGAFGQRSVVAARMQQVPLLKMIREIILLPHTLLLLTRQAGVMGFSVAALICFYDGFEPGTSADILAPHVISVLLTPLVPSLLFFATERVTRAKR